MPDVIIPVLDEAAALPGLLTGLPHGIPRRRRRQRLHRRVGRDRRPSGAPSSPSRAAGFGAACWAGLCAADPPTASSASWTATDRSTRPICRSSPTRCSTEAPTWSSGPAGPPPDGRGRCTHAPATWCWRGELRRRTGVPLGDLGPMRRRDATHCSRSGCRTAARAGRWRWCSGPRAAGWRIEEVAVPYAPADRPVEGDGNGAGDGARDHRHARRHAAAPADPGERP